MPDSLKNVGAEKRNRRQEESQGSTGLPLGPAFLHCLGWRRGSSLSKVAPAPHSITARSLFTGLQLWGAPPQTALPGRHALWLPSLP
jgi:hypothetical protein